MNSPSSTEGTTVPGRAMLLIEDVADELRVSIATVRDWVLARTVPHTKLPGTRRVLFPRAQLDLWLAGESDLIEKRTAGGGRVVRVRVTPRARGAVTV